MHRFYFSRLGLCDEANDTPSAGGGAPAPAAAAEPTAPAAAAAPEAKPGLLDSARAMVSSNAQLLASNRELTTLNGSLRAENARLLNELSTARAAQQAAEGELATVRQTLESAQQQQRSAQQIATDTVASLGVPETGLPAAAAKGAPPREQAIDELREQLGTTTDSAERGRLVAKIKALQAAA